jgi:hypothetical protein
MFAKQNTVSQHAKHCVERYAIVSINYLAVFFFICIFQTIIFSLLTGDQQARSFLPLSIKTRDEMIVFVFDFRESCCKKMLAKILAKFLRKFINAAFSVSLLQEAKLVRHMSNRRNIFVELF